MTGAAIRVEGLSKYYRLGLIGGGTLREDLQRWWALARGRPDPLLAVGREDHGNRRGGQIWALQDVSFDVEPGKVLGIIGRNGAGKSTLLKILSRITAPTSGVAKIRGRVGSLLEVGTGFHQELTGRENTYLNGAILGMKKAEIDGKFDEIVDFAEIEEFIDTPVKRYSSGMYVRLAFAVAAHLDPEILIVDEVLAVGDMAFQKKCLGKMENVSQSGRTVLFVSHQLGMISRLCDRVLLLAGGRRVREGETTEVVNAYVEMVDRGMSRTTEVECPEDEGLDAQVLAMSITVGDRQPAGAVDVGDPVTLKVRYAVRRPLEGVVCCFRLWRNGAVLFVSFDTDDDRALLEGRKPGVYETSVQLPVPLKAGHYALDVLLAKLKSGTIDNHSQVMRFDVEEIKSDTSMKSYALQRQGEVAVNLSWTTGRVG
jgi:lipopolysaccharide transport system ATP-binding protein